MATTFVCQRRARCASRCCGSCANSTRRRWEGTSVVTRLETVVTDSARHSVWWPGLSGAVEECVRTCPKYQRVKVDHLLPAGLLPPTPGPRTHAQISLDFLELPVAHPLCSGHDFLQVHMDLRIGRVWLVSSDSPPSRQRPPRQRGTTSSAHSVFRDVGLPDVRVFDRDTRFTS